MANFALAKAVAAIVIVTIILIGYTVPRISVYHRISVQLSSPPPAARGAPPAVGLKWNPPPGWPVPPPGWFPPPGWQPDLAWLPAPEGGNGGPRR
jgi:hypothetical protein